MSRLRVVLAVLLCVARSAFAQDGTGWPFPDTVTQHRVATSPQTHRWHIHDIALATTAVTFAWLDFSTTMDAVRRCQPYGVERKCYHSGQECVEGNPLIGCFPSPMRLRAVTAVALGAELYIGSRLHGWKRTAWFAGWTAISLSLVRYNVSQGWRVRITL